MPILFPNRNPNPLGFPGGILPGFDPSHIASGGITKGHGFSGVALGTNFVSLLSGTISTASGTAPTLGMDGTIGPSIVMTDNASTKLAFSGQSTANDATSTLASIFFLTAVPTTGQLIFGTSSGGNGFGTGVINSGNFIGYNYSSFTILNSGIALSASTPYFCAVSAKSGANNYIVKNLKTGKVTTATDATTFTSAAPNGTYQIGANLSIANADPANVAAVMFSPSYLTIAQLLAWARSPWDFWYPNRQQNIVGAATLAAIYGASLPLLRVG